ncbi:MAG TPA: hypothetical protein VEC37_02710 [Bacillota bacterium]|nr:hypothetical protein [Bacillota bacterium]
MSTTQLINNNSTPTQSTPTINYAPIIQGANSALKAMENDRLSAQKDQEHAEARLKEHYAEVKNLGVEPERLEEKITELDVELFEDMVATVELIPADYRRRFIDRAAFEAAIESMTYFAVIVKDDLWARVDAAITRAQAILNPPPPPTVEEGAEQGQINSGEGM